MVVLSIAPFTVGSNNFTISFVDSHNDPIDVSSATFQSKEPEQSIGPIIIDLDKVSKGVFKATAAFGIPGLWDLQIEGIPNTPNSAAISATFNDLRIKPRLDQFQFNITEFNTPSNLSQPLYPIYDKSRNSIWVGDTALDSSQILEFKLGSKEFVEHKINGTSIITIMALDSKNTIWFIDPINKLIGSYNIESGQSKLFPLPKEIVPSSIAVDPNDKLWIASSPTGQILIFDPAVGSFTKVIELGIGSRPLAIAINPNSGLAWVSDETGKLFMIDPLRNYNVTSYAPTLPSSALKSPTGLLIDDTNDKVYISQHEGHKVTAFNTIVQNFQDYPPLNPDGLPFGMAFDKYGNLWVAEHTINKIAVIDPQTAATKEVTIPNPNPFVQWLTSDSDGNIWIAEQRGHGLGLVTSQVSRSNIAELKSQTSATQSEENLPLPLINYNFVAVGIVIGSILVALMYVKNVIDCRVAEKTIRKYESMKY
jgi:copper transport protein